jgi:hypothetical protein
MMFESLQEWCRFPVNVYRKTGMAASGDASYASAASINGYRVDEMRVITDKTGKEYVSHTHVYFPPSANVTADDMISFPDDTKKREIRKLGGFSDGNTGVLDIIVVYL